MVDDFIQRSQLDSPPPEQDFADIADLTASCASSVSFLNLIENNITSIIWTTGFTGDFSYLKLPVLNSAGVIKHLNGIPDIEGLYFLGLPWLRKRKSGIILGIREDSQYIADLVIANRKASF
jgi:putative flavoprotein involved in K+ transport